MTVNILAFGIAKEILGESSIEISLQEGILVSELKAVLMQQFPGLKSLTAFMIAVNGEYAEPGTYINQDDEIAIIPPVSGG